tara:strand:+ start:337 stop:723 length:387 start_codon:yes stop_codon:yes gene_type:complete
MFQRKQRRFRRHSNSRNHGSRDNGSLQTRLRPDPFSNGPTRNNFRTPLSAEKLFDKYSSLAKEAMASGDKLLSENYLQHAEHFMRIIEDKNRNQNQSKVSLVDIPNKNNKNLSDSDDINKNSESKKKD